MNAVEFQDHVDAIRGRTVVMWAALVVGAGSALPFVAEGLIPLVPLVFFVPPIVWSWRDRKVDKGAVEVEGDLDSEFEDLLRSMNG